MHTPQYYCSNPTKVAEEHILDQRFSMEFNVICFSTQLFLISNEVWGHLHLFESCLFAQTVNNTDIVVISKL